MKRHIAANSMKTSEDILDDVNALGMTNDQQSKRVMACSRHLRPLGHNVGNMADLDRTGSAHRVDGLYCYVAGILFPIIFLSTAPYKTDRFIRFHSFQSIIFTLTRVAVITTSRLVRERTEVIPSVLSIAWIVFFITWILLMVKAYQGRAFKLPLIGRLASRWSG